MKNVLIIWISALFISSCSVESKPIEYGSDSCNFCKMNIVDDQHAAERVTDKGKVFKYDAIECMMNHMNREGISENEMALLLVCDYEEPGSLIDAKSATFIKSKAVPSPMGGDLSAYSKEDGAKKMVDQKGGEFFNWNELKNRYKVN